MLLNTEMDAFVSQINLPLLTDIIGFVFESAEKDYAKQRRVWQRCILLHFKPQMLSLLGRGRNIPVFGNTMLLSWVTGKMASAVKKFRTKDAALLRALCALRLPS